MPHKVGQTPVRRRPGFVELLWPKINISTVLAGQKLGVREVDDGIWIISFMHHDTIDDPFGTRLLPMS